MLHMWRKLAGRLPVWVGAVAVLAAALSVYLAAGSDRSASQRDAGNGPGPTKTRLWFYDLNAAKLYAADARDVPPMQAPSGGRGVRAHVFACGLCDAPDVEKVIAYLEMFTPAGKQQIDIYFQSAPPQSDLQYFDTQLMGVSQNDHLVSHPANIAWHAADSSEGIEIRAGSLGKLRARCKTQGKLLRACFAN